MVGTVKIIPFAVASASLDKVIAIANEEKAIAVCAFHRMKVGLVATKLPILKPSVMDKTRRLLDERLSRKIQVSKGLELTECYDKASDGSVLQYRTSHRFEV